MKITVLGDGSFGTALAQTLAHNGHHITLWCYDPEIATSIEQARCNIRFLPGLKLHKNITPSTSLKESLTTAEPAWIVEAIPVAYMRSVLSQITACAHVPWVVASKGIERDTNLLPADIVTQCVPHDIPTIILSGPSFALQLAQGQPTGLTLASRDITNAEGFRQVIESPSVVVDTTSDDHGTQLCGALKNVIALAMGILEGAGYEANTQALIFTKMVKELALIIDAYKGNQDTLLTFAGIGDITMTAYAAHSRNKALGIGIGKQEYRNKELPYTEGINTLSSIPAITRHVSTPLFHAVYEVVFNKQDVTSLIAVAQKK